MTRRLVALSVGCLLLSTVFAVAKPIESFWPRKLASCPDFVQLVVAKLKDVDGHKNPTNRCRPWPDNRGQTHHSNLVIENLRLHHFENNKAIMVNTGSPDKPRVRGQIASYKSVLLRNLDIGPVFRTQPGLHVDFIWIGPGHDDAFRPNVTLDTIFIHDGNSGVMPLLFEAGGRWGTLTFRRVAMANVAHPIMIKLGNSSFKQIIVEDCPGIRIALQGDPLAPVTVRVRNSPGADIQCPKDAQGRRATQVTIIR
ncbi:MAG: hypothetical protein ACM359_01320 [Bacillota bacterium]